MEDSVLIAMIAGICFILVARWLYLHLVQPWGKNQGWGDFDRQISMLLTLCDNGASLCIRGRRGGAELKLVRIGETGKNTAITLIVPRTVWSVNRAEKIRDVLESNGFDVAHRHPGDADSLVECWIEVEDIWDKRAGARTSRAAHLVMDACGVSQEEKFDFRLKGHGKWRHRPHAPQLEP